MEIEKERKDCLFVLVMCDYCNSHHKIKTEQYTMCNKSINLDDATAHYIAVSKNGEIKQSPIYAEICSFLEKE